MQQQPGLPSADTCRGTTGLPPEASQSVSTQSWVHNCSLVMPRYSRRVLPTEYTFPKSRLIKAPARGVRQEDILLSKIQFLPTAPFSIHLQQRIPYSTESSSLHLSSPSQAGPQHVEGGQETQPSPLISTLFFSLQPESWDRSALFVMAHTAGDQTDLIRHLQIRL